jgi:signal transduction histidine kinase
MTSNSGEIIGHICVLGEQSLAETENAKSYFNIFVTRASAELERLKIEREIIHHRDKLKELVDEKMASLRHAKESAEAANQVKTEFLARMTFELKIPVNSILGYAELLKEGDDALSAEQQGFIDNIISAGWLLDNVINDVLDISLAETGELFINHTRCRVTECIKESIKTIESQAKEKNIKIVCLYDASTDVRIVADKKRLMQIFMNLLSNAVKFNRDNSVVKVKITPAGINKIRISIIDRGVGIGEKDQHKIFEKFERLDAEECWIGGTGIGLAITKRLVEHMGGYIGVDSVLGEGSTFWVEFAST